MVGAGGRRVPYWEAGATFHPYSKGYFPEGQASTSAMMWMYATPDIAMMGGVGGFEGFGAGGFDFGGGGDGGGGGD